MTLLLGVRWVLGGLAWVLGSSIQCRRSAVLIAFNPDCYQERSQV